MAGPTTRNEICDLMFNQQWTTWISGRDRCRLGDPQAEGKIMYRYIFFSKASSLP